VTRLGLRLAFASGREAIVRLVAIAAAVALGVGVLLVSLAGINAVEAQSARTAWLNSSTRNLHPRGDESTADPLWAKANMDQYGTSVIERVDVAATGSRSPVPPGIPRLPGPGGTGERDPVAATSTRSMTDVPYWSMFPLAHKGSAVASSPRG